MYTNLCLFFPCTDLEHSNRSLHNAIRRLVDSNPSKSNNFDLFLIFNKGKDSDYQDLKEFVNNSSIKNIYIHILNIPDEQDIYIQPWKTKTLPTEIPKLGLSSGPNLSFYRSLNYLQELDGNYSHFLLLEADVFFLQKYWYDSLSEYCSKNRFSIAGSKYKGLSTAHRDSQYKDHLNGVAIYSNTSALTTILQKSEKTNEEYVKAGNHFLNFDIAIDIFRQLDEGHIISGENCFIDTDFIINCSDPSTDSELTKRDILNNFSNALILHQKQSESKNRGLSFSDEKERYTYNSKKNFLNRFVGNEIEGAKNIPLFFHVPKNAGTFVNNTFLVFLRFQTRTVNAHFDFDPESAAAPIDLRVVDNYGNHIFNLYVIDTYNMTKHDKRCTFKEGVTYEININSLNFVYLRRLSVLAVNVADNGFGYFEKLAEFFDHSEIQFVPFLFLRDSFSRAKSLFTYLGSSESSHEPTHKKILSDTFESYISSEQCEDSWLIRSLLNISDKDAITDEDLNSVVDLLSYFIVDDLSKSRAVTYTIFSKYCSLNYESINETWFDLVNKNARSNKLNIEFSDLTDSAQSQFQERSHYDNILYDRLIHKKDKLT